MIAEFGNVFLFLLLGVLFVAVSLTAAKLLRPNRPNAEKLATYECGETPFGSARVQFNNRFYIIGLMFLIFEVEILLLFPWVMVFQEIGWFAFFAMLVFVFLIFIGFAYELGKGHLQWDIPKPLVPRYVEGVGVVEEEPEEESLVEPVMETELKP
ncbi:NADH-quinone oxidoreductase subunit A [Fodinibius saliphilus]|uniref:NADH-quinone oxidoreductase subunit A n=1 Tax=Fodinibius saliphilus TaxID=1920650 RepID=UPI0011099744|nr:NADH-quinone oxidoreductase subunit A [Fodinibius saliphilus]